jgi:hypothetical protein
MSWILSLLSTIAVMILVIRDAKSRAQWSWPAFFWLLLLAVLYGAVCGLIALVVVEWVRPDDPGTGFLLVLVPIVVGAIPVSIIAKRIQRHFVRDTS